MNAKKARGDIILYGIFTVVGVILYKWIIPTQIYMSKTASAEPFSPDTFPNAVTILFILASLAGLILAIYHYCKAVKAEGKPVKEPVVRTRRETVGLFIPFIIFALILVYAVLFIQIGFIPATVIVPPVILFAVGCRKWSYYGIYYVFAAVMYLLFRYVLLVPIR